MRKVLQAVTMKIQGTNEKELKRKTKSRRNRRNLCHQWYKNSWRERSSVKDTFLAKVTKL